MKTNKMKTRKMKTINLKQMLLAAVGATFLTASTAEARDDQAWLTLEASGAFTKDSEAHPYLSNLGWKVEEQLKYTHSYLNAEETLALLNYKFCSWFSAAAGYRLARERKAGQTFKNEHRPTLDLNFTAPEFMTLKLDFRSRFEVRNKQGSDTYMRYRERLRLRTSWSVTDFKISPYASCEFFFEDRPKDGWKADDWFNRTRTQVGFTFRPLPSVKNLSAAAYFMVEHNCEDMGVKWDPTNIYGLNLVYKF